MSGDAHPYLKQASHGSGLRALIMSFVKWASATTMAPALRPRHKVWSIENMRDYEGLHSVHGPTLSKKRTDFLTL